MSSAKISKQIMEAIRERTKTSESIKGFLTELLYEESKRPRSWWFKEYYKKKIEEYSEKWDGENED